VALKLIEEHSANTRQLLKEIIIMQECACNFIVSYRGCFRKDNLFYIAMEFCEVGSVWDLMASIEHTLEEPQVAAVAKCVLKGLICLHKKKKIHRDIKAGNILLNKNGECKLADFGVSAQLSQTCSLRGTTTGTPYWMAPEVLTKDPYDYKADIWSLGIACIEMATADVPHSSIPPLQAMGVIPNQPPPTLPRGQWSPAFKDFIRSSCNKTYTKRPTAVELLKHPFVADIKEDEILRDLVVRGLPKVNAYRERLRRELAYLEEMRRRAELQETANDQDTQEQMRMEYDSLFGEQQQDQKDKSEEKKI